MVNILKTEIKKTNPNQMHEPGKGETVRRILLCKDIEVIIGVRVYPSITHVHIAVSLKQWMGDKSQWRRKIASKTQEIILRFFFCLLVLCHGPQTQTFNG